MLLHVCSKTLISSFRCLIRVGAKLCRDTSPSGPNLVTPGIKDDWVYGLQMSKPCTLSTDLCYYTLYANQQVLNFSKCSWFLKLQLQNLWLPFKTVLKYNAHVESASCNLPSDVQPGTAGLRFTIKETVMHNTLCTAL